jgi:hypothetical protein
MSRHSTLILEDYPEQNLKFLEDEGITLIQFGIPGNKVRKQNSMLPCECSRLAF